MGSNERRAIAMPPLYVSYYTIGNGYEVEAAGLVRTLENFKLPYRVCSVVINASGPTSWQHAATHKAVFIREMQHDYPERPLVWLDADARVIQRPRMFEWLTCDLAAHWYRNVELLSSTLYFAPGKASRAVVEAWIKRNHDRPDRRHADQPNLMDVIAARRDLRLVNLPPEYAWIDAGSGSDLSARAYGRRYPIIAQLQASRRLKHR
jgi:hypothetical protein